MTQYLQNAVLGYPRAGLRMYKALVKKIFWKFFLYYCIDIKGEKKIRFFFELIS